MSTLVTKLNALMSKLCSETNFTFLSMRLPFPGGCNHRNNLNDFLLNLALVHWEEIKAKLSIWAKLLKKRNRRQTSDIKASIPSGKYIYVWPNDRKKQERMQYYYKYYLNITIQQLFKKTTLKEKVWIQKMHKKT